MVTSALPIIELSQSDRLWLQASYANSIVGRKNDVKELWGQLVNKIPKGYRPDQIDRRLCYSNGENIRIPGVIALQKRFTVIKKVDKVIESLRKELIRNTTLTSFSLNEHAASLNISLSEFNFYLRLAGDYLTLYSGGSVENHTINYLSINIERELQIFYNYKDYQGIEKLVLKDVYGKPETASEYFTQDERLLLEHKVDGIAKDIEILKLGQEIIWTDMIEQMEDLKTQLSLPKKNWRQILIGKLYEMIVSGIISEAVSKRIVEVFSPVVGEMISAIRFLPKNG